MFAEWKPSSPERWRLALLISLALHSIAVLLLSYHSPAGAVLPREVALGTPFSSGSVIYLAPLGREQARDSKPLQVAKENPKQELSLRSKRLAAHREQASKTASSAPEITARAGSPYGSRIPGTPLTGDAVM